MSTVAQAAAFYDAERVRLAGRETNLHDTAYLAGLRGMVEHLKKQPSSERTLGLPSSRDQDDAPEERSEVGELHGPLKALLSASNSYPTPQGAVWMALSRDRAVEILNACSHLTPMGIVFEHVDSDMTSMQLTAYITLSRSELGMEPCA